MLVEIKKLSAFVAILSVCLLLAIHPALALNKPPATGGTLPQFELAAPQNATAKDYLGLSDTEQFTVPQIKAKAVIIEVFSMY